MTSVMHKQDKCHLPLATNRFILIYKIPIMLNCSQMIRNRVFVSEMS
jgi:hypothetical protein